MKRLKVLSKKTTYFDLSTLLFSSPDRKIEGLFSSFSCWAQEIPMAYYPKINEFLMDEAVSNRMTQEQQYKENKFDKIVR